MRILLTALILLTACSSGSGDDPIYYADVQAGDETSGQDLGPGSDSTALDTATDFQGLLDLDQEFPPGPDSMTFPDTDTEENPLCQGDNDGQLTADELPTLLGAVASFTQNAPGTIATVPEPEGTWDPDCPCSHWDLSQASPDDGLVYDGVLDPDGFWFSEIIPGGDFVQSFEGGVLGVYALETDGLYLMGLASEQEDWTALRYDPPVRLLTLPMSLGDSWSSVAAQAVGLYEGETYPLDTGFTGVLSVEHSFYGKVDRKGSVAVPAGEFEAWRVLVDVTMEVRNSLSIVPIYASHRKIALFMAECTGLVARIRSEENETSDFFTTATEYRRLGFFNNREEADGS